MDLKNFGLAIIAIFLVGCASMPEENYRAMASLAGLSERCYQVNLFDSNLRAQTRQAINLNLSTWSYDQQKFQSMAEKYYSNSYPSSSNCQSAKTKAYQLIAQARQHQASMQAANQSLYQAQQNSAAMYQQSMQSLNQQLMQLPPPGAGLSTGSGYTPQPFYPSNSCLGTVVNGVCQGTVNPSATQKCCHGTIVNGQCMGTVVNGPC
jgi:hypothetical protein